MRKICTVILLILFSSIVFYANAQSVNDNNATGGYLGYGYDKQSIPDATGNNVISESWIEFWQLPTWIQLLGASVLILGILGLAGFIFGRLSHALENPKTKEIFYFIQRNPGMTIAEVSEQQNINRGTLKYHLSQLLINNKIVFRRDGKFSRLFYNNTSVVDKESILTRYMRNDKSRDILFTIMDTPGVTNQELSSRFELAKSTTHEYLKNLSDDGIVEFRQDGKFKRCYLMQDARIILLRYRPQ